ncbi:hypothetical protein D3C80_1453310 [compost metagenome]
MVSNVFGKQFSNNHANSGLAICFLMRTIAFSIALLVNFLCAKGGRWLTKSFGSKLKIESELNAKASVCKARIPVEKIPVFFKNFLRDCIRLFFICDDHEFTNYHTSKNIETHEFMTKNYFFEYE